jgi:hypothetical protein
MLRSVLGALAGIATAVVTVMLMDWLSHIVYPPPDGIEIMDTEALNAYLAAAPVGALVIMLVGYLMATFDGVVVACLIGRVQPVIYALTIGVLMLAGTVSNLIMLQHPTWFSVSAIVGIIVSAWLASQFAAQFEARGLPKRSDAG